MKRFLQFTLLACYAFPGLANDDPQWWVITSEAEPIVSADVVVVGSGLGATGFLHRLVRHDSNLSVIWIEKD